MVIFPPPCRCYQTPGNALCTTHVPTTCACATWSTCSTVGPWCGQGPGGNTYASTHYPSALPQATTRVSTQHPSTLYPSPSHYTCLHPAPLYPLPFIQHIPQIPACISLPPAPAACPTPLPSSSHHAPLRAAFALQVPPGFESTLIDELSSLGVECDPATQLVVVCEVGTPMPITWVGG